jgi:diadenosine tetraphosphatase ApaH/serine/threonine PP2A family protein phosphatase
VWALISDVHGNLRALERALAYAREEGAHSVAFLGDALGGVETDEACCRVLMRKCELAVFGCREVRVRLAFPEDVQRWIRSLPATAQIGDVLLCHSSPASRYPHDITAGDALEFRRGLSYFDLFPYVSGKRAALAAVAALADPACRVVVHGHTHSQKVWCVENDVTEPIRGVKQERGQRRDWDVDLGCGTTVVGLGSVGKGKDGQVEFGLFSPADWNIRLVSLPGE